MSDSHGSALSTTPSTSSRRRSSKIAGCAGVFFQIFNGKRLFSRKSLPAERLNQDSVSHNHINEKLPIAKLLLIADENVGSSTDIAHKDSQEDHIFLDDEACEEKHGKRTPNVVARLMGLETMPSPEPLPAKKKHREPDKVNLEWHGMPSQKEQESASDNIPFMQSQSLHHKAKSRKPSNRLEKYPMRQKGLSSSVCDSKIDGYEWNGTSVSGASMFPYSLDSTCPSVSPSSMGGLYKNKPPIYKKRSSYLNEPVTRAHESNSQPINRTKNQGQGVVSWSLNGPKSYKSRLGREISFEDSCDDGPTTEATSRHQEYNAQFRSRKTSYETINRRSGDAWRYKGLQNEPIHSRTSKVHTQKSTFQNESKLVKVKGTRNRSDETSRRLNQLPAHRMKSQSSRLTGSQVLRHSSSNKPCLGLKPSQASLQNARGIVSSNESEVSKLMNSYVDSNILPAKTSTSSSVNGCLEQPDELSNCMEAMACETFLHEEISNMMHDEVVNSADATILEQCLTSKTERSRGGLSSATCTQNNWSCTQTLANLPGSQFLQDADEQSSYFNAAGGIAQGVVLESLKAEDCIQSSCDSFFGDSADTVTSHAESDISSKTCDSISYSGKNAGAILQELLIALSSSTSGLKPSRDSDNVAVSPPVSKIEVTSSRLKPLEKYGDAIMGQTESYLPVSEISPDFDGSLCTRDSMVIEEDQQPSLAHSLESPFQDSVSGNASGSPPGKSDPKNLHHVEVCREQSVGIDVIERARIAEKLPVYKDFERGAVDCDALLDTISRLHCIDPKTIGLHTRHDGDHGRDEKSRTVFDMDSSDGSGLLSNFEKPVQNSDWGFSMSSSSASGNNEDVESFCKARQNQYEEAIVQNKKLISDCINEAFKNIGTQMYGISSFTDPSSAAHVVSKVYKQIDDWKAMAVGMNLDDIVEKEMDITTARWHNFCNEGEAVAEIIEQRIFDQLLEEFALELM